MEESNGICTEAKAVDPTPYRVDVPEQVLTDLKQRLARTRWPDEVPGAGWDYGTDLTYLKELVDYWQERYDWRRHEALLNGLAQFTIPIAGITLHFIHQRGVGPNPLPLLLSHGWPGSVWEFYQLIPLLTDPGRFGGDPADAFTVVAPSLPGYAFSFQPNQPRLGIAQMADLFAELMTELGYPRFAAAGGDWGASITSRLAFAHPDRLYGVHLTMLSVRPTGPMPAATTDEERRYLAEQEEWQREGIGYQWIQGTRPQTLAYALTDSPVGLAAWIVEKLRAWSDCHGQIESRFTKDELLTNVMLYWVTGCIGASFWPYYTRRHGEWSPSELIGTGRRIEVPTAYAAFPREITRPPRSWAERVYNIVRWTPLTAGGHFAALEEPHALASDLQEFFRQLRT